MLCYDVGGNDVDDDDGDNDGDCGNDVDDGDDDDGLESGRFCRQTPAISAARHTPVGNS